MAYGQKAIVVGDEFALGTLTLTAADIAALQGDKVNKNGVVLIDSRIKVLIPMDVEPYTDAAGEHDGTGELVEFTLSLYISRGAITEREAIEVSEAGDEQQAKKKAREKDAADKLAHEKREMFSLGLQAARQADTLNARLVQRGRAAAAEMLEAAEPTPTAIVKAATQAVASRRTYGKR